MPKSPNARHVSGRRIPTSRVSISMPSCVCSIPSNPSSAVNPIRTSRAPRMCSRPQEKPMSAYEWQHDDPECALTLPSGYFYDQHIHELERDRIFMSAWHLLGHRNELSRPGAYVVRDIFDQS